METQKYISLGCHTLRFGGGGRYKRPAQDLEVHVVIDYVLDPENDYESAHVMAGYKDTDWDTYTQGDIYGDKTFQEGVREILKDHGFLNFDEMFGYSESGMQHEFYVHFDLAVNKKLREAEGNFEFPWERVHEFAEMKKLDHELYCLDQDRKNKKKRLRELKKKYDVK